MNINIGSIVSRNSYNNDLVFIVTKIEGDIAFLKGADVRLCADSPISDLKIAQISDDYDPEIEVDELDRDEYFYIPGKILHIDADNLLSKMQKSTKINGNMQY